MPAEQVYHEMCAQDGLSLTQPAAHKVREYSLASLPGAYRRLLIRPKDLSWQLLQYQDADTPLAITELDKAAAGDAQVTDLACKPVVAGGQAHAAQSCLP